MDNSKCHIVISNKGGEFWEGGRQYTRNLIRAILSLPDEELNSVELSLLVNGQEELKAYDDFLSKLKICGDSNTILDPFTFVNRVRWKLKRVFKESFNSRLEEFLCSIGTTFAYPLMTSKSDRQSFRSAEWIPDFQYKHYPQASNTQEIEERKQAFRHIADNAQTIVLSSHHAERDCLELFPHTKGKTFVLQFRVFADDTWWSLSPTQTISKYRLPERYLIVSNLLAPTKNHFIVLKSLKILKDRHQAMPIVFTGDIYDYRNPGYYNKFLSCIHQLGLHNDVRVLGLIPKVDQFQLLRGSIALLQPSLFEGWHTGVEEARLLGKTLLLSDIPVHQEQDPPNRLFFDPYSPETLAKQMLVAFESNTLGYDEEKEIIARQSYSELQLDYARKFLKLAKS
ncbi:glycosyltransferase [Moorena sp. SIO4A5]|uniref:glycosyltransferase n=1 Tax=Moorena sp. SIO4A5 TaxID=2607838 RepID=UPI0013CA593E|nr:glycosyltransferase [Moorena sp. SIO4A5]NEO21422.1 glycosyltransferase family 4 protein [Moorena sp. SIO4A5]